MQMLSKIGGRLQGLWRSELCISRPDGEVESVDLDGISAQCHWSFPSDIRTPWNSLADHAPAGTTFVSPRWQIHGIAPRLPATSLRLLTAHRGNELLAAIPMELKPGGFLESAGSAISDYLDPLTSGDNDRATWRAVLSLLDQLWDKNLKAITFRNVRDSSTARTLLPTLAPEFSLAYEEEITSNAARIDLPSTWEGYLESLDSHERKELRRKVKKAQTQANAQLQIFDGSTMTPEHLATALNLIEAADESKKQWLQLNVRPMLTNIALDLARENRLRLMMLTLNDAPAACLIDLPSRRGPLLYNSGFDPAQRPWSPGAVTFALAIQDAIARRAPVFDMLRGQESYKYRLGAKDAPVYRLTLHR